LVAVGCGAERPAVSDGAGTGIFAPGTACTSNGTKVECHAVVSQHDGIVNCFNGQQTCMDGAWTACQGDPTSGGSITTKALGSVGQGLSIASLGSSSATGSPCSNNPCNPNCVGWHEVPATPISPLSCSAGGTVTIPSAPSIPTANQADNVGDCNATNSNQGCWWAAECCAKPAGTYVCQDQASAACQRYAGVDFSTTIACVAPGATRGTGKIHEWVCNQGTTSTTSTATPLVVQFWDGSTHAGDDLHQGSPQGGDWGTYYGRCVIDLTKVTLNSKGCVDVFDLPQTGITCDKGTTSAGAAWPSPGTDLLSKKFVAWVNGLATKVTEGTPWNNVGGIAAPPNCSPGNASAPACPSGYTCTGTGTSSYCQGAACATDAGCGDGATCTSSKCKLIQPQCQSTATATPKSYPQQYQLACPAGYRGQWETLAYDTTATGGAKVAFAVQTSSASTGPWTPSTVGPPDGVKVAETPTDHPASCSMAGPAPNCPVDINTPLKTASAGAEQNAYLNVNVLLTPVCGTIASFSAGSTAFGSSPPSFTNKAVCGAGNSTAITTGCKDLSACSTSPDHYSKWDACQFDYYCDDAAPNATKGICKPWATDAKWSTTVCPVGAGPDLTIGASCTFEGQDGFPVCNRGNDPVAAGEVIEIFINNGSSWDWPASAGGASTYQDPTCSYTTAAAIAPGKCVFVSGANTTPSCTWSGNSVAYVNSRQRIKECGMTGWVAGNYTDSAVAKRPTGNTPGTSNNDADIKKGQAGACQTVSGAGNSVPTLNSWDVTFSCVPTE
jgi:hypothetical protein